MSPYDLNQRAIYVLYEISNLNISSVIFQFYISAIITSKCDICKTPLTKTLGDECMEISALRLSSLFPKISKYQTRDEIEILQILCVRGNCKVPRGKTHVTLCVRQGPK